MFVTGSLFLLLSFFLGLLLAVAAVGLGVFFLVRYFRRRGAKKRQQAEQDREMDRMKIDDLQGQKNRPCIRNARDAGAIFCA